MRGVPSSRRDRSAMTVDTIVIAIAAAAVAGLILAFLLHFAGRAMTRSRLERQRDLEGTIIYSLQTGTIADEMVLRLGRSPQDLARRSLAHALRTLGEPCRNYLTYVYDQLNFGARALRDLRAWSWARRADAVLELG